jgi:hypothetical protein
MKKCTKCKEEKELLCFGRDKSTKDGYYPQCKKCCAIRDKKKYFNNRDKIIEHGRQYKKKNEEVIRKKYKQYYEQNREKCLMKSRKWKTNNPERVRERVKLWAENHPDAARQRWDKNKDKIREVSRLWRKNNPEKVREFTDRANTKVRGTLKGRLMNSIRSGIHSTIVRGSKDRRHWEDLVGYTIDQLKKHLEKLFTPEMTWENYGTVWEIDHKIPIAAFNFQKPDDLDFRLCWTLRNLQPLGVAENRVKHDKIDKPFQPSLCVAV